MRQPIEDRASDDARVERRLKHLPPTLRPYFDGSPAPSLTVDEVHSMVVRTSPAGFGWLVTRLEHDPEDRGRTVFCAWNPSHLRPDEARLLDPQSVDEMLRAMLRRVLDLGSGVYLLLFMESPGDMPPLATSSSAVAWRKLDLFGVLSTPYVSDQAELEALGYAESG
jgi:hypothetical protein